MCRHKVVMWLNVIHLNHVTNSNSVDNPRVYFAMDNNQYSNDRVHKNFLNKDKHILNCSIFHNASEYIACDGVSLVKLTILYLGWNLTTLQLCHHIYTGGTTHSGKYAYHMLFVMVAVIWCWLILSYHIEVLHWHCNNCAFRLPFSNEDGATTRKYMCKYIAKSTRVLWCKQIPNQSSTPNMIRGCTIYP